MENNNNNNNNNNNENVKFISMPKSDSRSTIKIETRKSLKETKKPSFDSRTFTINMQRYIYYFYFHFYFILYFV